MMSGSRCLQMRLSVSFGCGSCVSPHERSLPRLHPTLPPTSCFATHVLQQLVFALVSTPLRVWLRLPLSLRVDDKPCAFHPSFVHIVCALSVCTGPSRAEDAGYRVVSELWSAQGCSVRVPRVLQAVLPAAFSRGARAEDEAAQEGVHCLWQCARGGTERPLPALPPSWLLRYVQRCEP